MEFSFGFSEVERWAAFSGDFNPIHFDLAHARRAGQAELIVHGMLALLPVKERFASASNSGGNAKDGWMEFRALFRSPIPHTAPLQLLITPGREGHIFRCRAPGTEREYFRGSCKPASPPEHGNADGPAASGRKIDATLIRQFARSYPATVAPWIALDAIVFSEFMRHEIGPIEQRIHAQMAAAGTADDKAILAMQLSHSVLFNSGSAGENGFSDPDALNYGPATIDIVDGKDQWSVMASLPVRHGRRTLVHIEIGLLLKASGKTSSNN